MLEPSIYSFVQRRVRQAAARCLPVILAACLFLPALGAAPGAGLFSSPALSDDETSPPPLVVAGQDFTIAPGFEALFFGYGASPGGEYLTYAWDFDGDGTQDFTSLFSAVTTHAYPEAGVYTATLTVSGQSGRSAARSVTVQVVEGGEGQVFHPQQVETGLPGLRTLAAPVLPPDGVRQLYVVMINGGAETRFWNDVTFMYTTLTNTAHIAPDHILLFNYEGSDPWGGNPGGMIDYPASIAALHEGFDLLASLVDGDDHLFIWVTDHGTGYYGKPEDPSYGMLATFASVDPGDEQDYLEHDFVLRALTMYHYFMYNAYYAASNTTVYFRRMYVGQFNHLYFEHLGYRSDSDVFLERLVDLLMGDTNRDAVIDPSLGEVFDYDGDGNMPYTPETGEFDPDDWGPLDYFTENEAWLVTQVPGGLYRLFDEGQDGQVEIDLNYAGGVPVIDGADLDGDGRFDFLDVNEYGDLDDWVSIDEEIHLVGYGMLDDEFAGMVDQVGAGEISVFMLPCFSGGFIDDLSAPNRVISTAAEEEALSYGNLFAELFTSALRGSTRYGTPIYADADGDHRVSMLEAFNYAAGRDTNNETPQYDDNGDGVSQHYPVPAGGDGSFGATIFLVPGLDSSIVPIDIRPKSSTNPIDPTSVGDVTVAILSSPGVLISDWVDPDSLTFGHSGSEESLVWRKGVPGCSAQDINQDQIPDLVCSFSIPRAGFQCGDHQGILRGKTVYGGLFEGVDTVTLTHCP